MNTKINLYYGTSLYQLSVEPTATEGDIFFNTEAWTIHQKNDTAWVDSTDTSDVGLFFLAPETGNGVRTLNLVEYVEDLPTTYVANDLFFCTQTITATAPTYGDYDKTYQPYVLYVSTGSSVSVFDNEEWVHIDYFYPDTDNTRIQSLRHGIQPDYDVGDLFVPESNTQYTGGSYADYLFQQDAVYFALDPYFDEFDPSNWARLLETRETVTEDTAYQRVEIINSGDTITPVEKLSLKQEWNNHTASYNDLNSQATPYLFNFLYVQTAQSDLYDSYNMLDSFLFNSDNGVLRDMNTPSIQVGLWDAYERLTESLRMQLDLFSEAIERAKTQYEQLTGWDSEVDGNTVSSTPNVVTNFIVTPGINSIQVEWEPQGLLTNFKHYVVQASDDDGATWHSLQIDKFNSTIGSETVTWLGADGTSTIVTENLAILENIPGYTPSGYSVPEQGRTFQFRVKIVTKLSSEGPFGVTSGSSEIARTTDVSFATQRALATAGNYKAVDVEEIDGIPTYAINRGVWSDTFENYAKTNDGVDLVMYRIEDVTDNLGNVMYSQYVEDHSEATAGKVLGRWEQVGGFFPQDYSSVRSGEAKSGGFYLRVGNNAGNDEAWLVSSQSLPFDSDKMYRVRARVRRVSGNSSFYIGLAGRNEDDSAWVNQSGLDLVTNQYHIAASDEQSVLGEWVEYIGYIGAHYVTTDLGDYTYKDGYDGSYVSVASDPNNPSKFHSSVRYFRPMFIFNHDDTLGEIDIDYVQVEEIDPTIVQKVELWSYGARPFSIDGDKVSGVMTSKTNPEFNFWDLETGEFKVGIGTTAFFHVNPLESSIEIEGLNISLTSSDLKTFFYSSDFVGEDPFVTPYDKEFVHNSGGMYWGNYGSTTPNSFDGKLEWEGNSDDIVLSTSVGKIRLSASGGDGDIVISSNGNIGIGENNPASALHIQGKVRIHDDTDEYDWQNAYGMVLSAEAGKSYGFIQSPNDLHLMQNAYYDGQWNAMNPGSLGGFQTELSNNNLFVVRGTSVTLVDDPVTFVDWLTIKDSGEVGIGTSSPSAKLDIDGNVKIAAEATFSGMFEIQYNSNTSTLDMNYVGG